MTRKLIPKDPALQGGGHYVAARRDRAAQAFVKAGKLKPATGVAKPATPEEPGALREAEDAGRAPARR